MTIEIEQQGDTTVVWLGGECDISTDAELTGALTTALLHTERIVVVDCSRLRFAGSILTHRLQEACGLASNRAVSFHIRGARGIVRRVLDLTYADRPRLGSSLA